jgi:hypothetical protein
MTVEPGRIPNSADPLTWGCGCDIIDGVREVPVGVLAPGQRFDLVLSATTGKRIRGTVIGRRAQSVAVELDEGRGARSFTTAEGETIQLGGEKARTAWSPDTPVLIISKGETKMVEKAVALPGIGTAKVAAKAAKARAKAKHKPARAAKRARTPKALNSCLCGCGEQVSGRFRQGHDSRYYSLIKKVSRKELGFDKLPRAMREALGGMAGVMTALKAHG